MVMVSYSMGLKPEPWSVIALSMFNRTMSTDVFPAFSILYILCFTHSTPSILSPYPACSSRLCTLICTLSQQISDMFALQLQISLSLLCRHYSRSMLHTASDYYRLHSVDSGLCVSSLSCSCQSCPCLTPPGPRSFPSIASRAPARSVGPAKSRCVPFIPRKLT